MKASPFLLHLPWWTNSALQPTCTRLHTQSHTSSHHSRNCYGGSSEAHSCGVLTCTLNLCRHDHTHLEGSYLARHWCRTPLSGLSGEHGCCLRFSSVCIFTLAPKQNIKVLLAGLSSLSVMHTLYYQCSLCSFCNKRLTASTKFFEISLLCWHLSVIILLDVSLFPLNMFLKQKKNSFSFPVF